MTETRHVRPYRLVISPPPRIAFPAPATLWDAREVLLRFAARDITLRYRQTLLGVLWVVLQPLLTALVFALVFGKVAKLPSGGIPYVVFSFVGLLAWNLFNGIVTRASAALLQNSALVSKVFFPRVLVPLSVACTALLDFAVSLAFLVILFAANGVWPSWPVLLLPLWVTLVVLFASGLGCVLSAWMVSYRDVQYIVPFVWQFLLYGSPVAYSLDAVPDRYRIIYDANPLTWILEEFRWSLLDGPAPPAWQVVGSIVVSLTVFVGCMMAFEQMERGLADVI